jgi:N utilization substance protein B
MGIRHAARVLAVQAIYAMEMNPDAEPEEAVRSATAEAEAPSADEELLRELVTGVHSHLPTLDRTVERISRNWKVRRMDRVDKSILRLGVYELLHHGETPAAVVLDECIELAKAFGTPDSPAFINGILDRVAREARAAEFPPEA